MKVLVMGCTGTVGRHVAMQLLPSKAAVRCMTHISDNLGKLPRGVEGRIGDLEYATSLTPLFEGMDGLFLLNAVGPNETKHGLAAVHAAKEAGIKKIVYLSVYMPAESEQIPHFGSKLPIEDAVKHSGIPWTILRPNNFFQNDIVMRDVIVQQGIYPQPIGGKGLSRVDVRDIAACAVHALLMPGHEGMTYAVHGPDALSGAEVARIYTRRLGRVVKYGGDDLDAWADQMQGIMTDSMILDLKTMYAYFQSHGMIAAKADLTRERKLLGRSPRSFDDFAQEIAKDWSVPLPRAA